MADYAMNWRLDTAFDKLRQRPRQQRPRWLSLAKPVWIPEAFVARLLNLQSKILAQGVALTRPVCSACSDSANSAACAVRLA